MNADKRGCVETYKTSYICVYLSISVELISHKMSD
jgi:hypothetical protein